MAVIRVIHVICQVLHSDESLATSPGPFHCTGTLEIDVNNWRAHTEYRNGKSEVVMPQNASKRILTMNILATCYVKQLSSGI